MPTYASIHFHQQNIMQIKMLQVIQKCLIMFLLFCHEHMHQ